MWYIILILGIIYNYYSVSNNDKAKVIIRFTIDLWHMDSIITQYSFIQCLSHVIVYNVWCTLYTVHCTMYTVHCTMHNVQCTHMHL